MNKKHLAFLYIFFITQSVFAEFICDTSVDEYSAVYEINTYDCEKGKFLPANSLECKLCPIGFSCPGGIFDFNSDYFQGLNFDVNNISNEIINNICASNFPSDLIAINEPNQHTCLPGYYLPIGIDECTICPAGSYCVGGTYTFNETTTQGIETCPEGMISMAGAPACYPHILHIDNDVIYLKSTKLTTPSLNVGMDDGVFYANMTTTPTRMNAGTERYLKIEYDGTIYYVCDDTTFAQ